MYNIVISGSTSSIVLFVFFSFLLPCLQNSELSVSAESLFFFVFSEKRKIERERSSSGNRARVLFGSEADMGTSRRQLKAMLRKNWLLKIRHPFVTLAEVSVSLLFLLLLREPESCFAL